MKRFTALFVVLFLLLLGCTESGTTGKLIPVTPPVGKVDYLADIKPILDKRCVVCHSCYNSPCQLKLSSYDGLDRGATKKQVYDAHRLRTMEPTRLFVDAHTTEQWREKGFHSVLESDVDSINENNSFLLKMLHQKKVDEGLKGEFKPEKTEELVCAATGVELDEYLTKHPNRGMPYGFPPLKDDEYRLISDWMVLGAKGPSAREQAERSKIHENDVELVQQWESFLNRKDPKHVMTARYLYEHLFLAHITFGTSTSFYEIVRSTTPPGEEIRVIATVRPYDDPGSEFYYRFQRIFSTIVHKTHMVFPLSQSQFNRIQQLFIEPEWLEEPYIETYSKKRNASPFVIFKQIPPRSRYQFLLDNANYIIMTFIRGPVCKGQVALNVVRDHFWVMFMDPEADLSIQHPEFLQENLKRLRMPTEQGSFFSLFRSWRIIRYYKQAARYVKARQHYYGEGYKGKGLDSSMIWKGNSGEDTPMLTVFRHFDSASVHKGGLGGLPRTQWVLDYPLMERIYYALVAGFDVYGSLGHQLGVRVYMDGLRQEAETYFLDFMPLESRPALMQNYYGGMSLQKIKYQPSPLPTAIEFSTREPQREFIEHLVTSHFHPDTGIRFDENYLKSGENYPDLPVVYKSREDYIRGFHAASAPGDSFFKHVKDHNANIALVRIIISETESEVVSMVIHRHHDDVRTMSKEEDNLNPDKDEADFIPGYIGSYPNYFFVVDLADLPEFLRSLKEYDGSETAINSIARFGINRAHPKFWFHYDWFQKDFNSKEPDKAGLFDLNRYYYLADKELVFEPKNAR